MRFVLQRYSDGGDSTLGLLFIRRETPKLGFIGYTLEDEHRNKKVSKETRIWSGEYELQLRRVDSPLTLKYRARFPWFRYHVEVTNVPEFAYVYVHIGNTDEDTDACILLGDTANNNQIDAGFVGHSTQAYQRWYELIAPYLEAGGRAFLEVKDEGRLW